MDAVSYFLVFLAILLIGFAAWAGAGGTSGIFFRRGRSGRDIHPGLLDSGNSGGGDSDGAYSDGGLLDGGFEQPVANLPPVLLPAKAGPADVDRVRFSLGLRGYRMDQVDQVLDELRDQLAAKEEELERLRGRLLEAEQSRRTAASTEPASTETVSRVPGAREPASGQSSTVTPNGELELNEPMVRSERETAEGAL